MCAHRSLDDCNMKGTVFPDDRVDALVEDGVRPLEVPEVDQLDTGDVHDAGLWLASLRALAL